MFVSNTDREERVDDLFEHREEAQIQRLEDVRRVRDEEYDLDVFPSHKSTLSFDLCEERRKKGRGY